MSLKIYESNGVVKSYRHFVTTIICENVNITFKVDPILCGSFDAFINLLTNETTDTVEQCVCMYKNIYTIITLTKTYISVKLIHSINDESQLVLNETNINYCSQSIPELIETFKSLTEFVKNKKRP